MKFNDAGILVKSIPHLQTPLCQWSAGVSAPFCSRPSRLPREDRQHLADVTVNNNHESNNTKVIHNNTFIQFCKENATQKMSKTFISEFHIFCQNERSTLWMVPLSFEMCWFIWTFNFSQFSDVRLSWVRWVHKEKRREAEVETQIDLENWWSPALVPRHTNINYPLLINAIRPRMIVDSCRRCWPCLYTVHVPLTLCLWGFRNSI